MSGSEQAEAAGGIVVLGTPRSGTTLLRRILDAHPDITCPGETNILSGCARLLREDVIAEDFRVGVLAGLGHAGFSREEVLDRLRAFAFSFHRELAERAETRRWAEKTAFDAFHLEEIVELCGEEVQYICVVRRGLDVVCSLEELSSKNQGYLPELHEYVRRFPSFYEAFAQCWVDLTEKILDFAETAPNRAVLLRYEDLVVDTDRELDRLFSFLGEELPGDLVGRALGSTANLGLGDWKTYGRSGMDASSIGRGSRLGPRTRGLLAETLNPTLERAGYDPIPIPTEEDEEQRRRRYEFGLIAQRLAEVSEEPE